MRLLVVLRFHGREPKEMQRSYASCAARPPARAVTHIALVRLRSQSTRSRSHSPSNRHVRMYSSGKIARDHSLHAPTRANIPTSPYGSRRFKAKWKPRNWLRETSVSLSDTPQHLLRRVLLGKRLNPHGRSGRRRAASRKQINWFAATAGAMTWLRVSLSGAIADAASASANAIGRRRGPVRRRSRNRYATDVGKDWA